MGDKTPGQLAAASTATAPVVIREKIVPAEEGGTNPAEEI